MSAANAAAKPAAKKSFSQIEELGFILANYLIRNHPLPEGTTKMEVYDKTFEASFKIYRKGEIVYAAPVKQQKKRVPKPGSGETPDSPKGPGKEQKEESEPKE